MSYAQGVPIPPKTDPRWAALVTSGTSRPIKLLAIKLMLKRMTQDAKSDLSSAGIAKNIDELYGFFLKNARMVETDTATLFG